MCGLDISFIIFIGVSVISILGFIGYLAMLFFEDDRIFVAKLKVKQDRRKEKILNDLGLQIYQDVATIQKVNDINENLRELKQEINERLEKLENKGKKK